MYLPILINVKKQTFTIFGGGKIALRKTLKILEYGGSVHLISPDFDSGFEGLERVYYKASVYKKNLLPKYGLVIAATNDEKVNQRILMDCEELGIFCARVDCGKESDFIFSANWQSEDLIISVSTKGKNPIKAKQILKELTEQYDGKKEKNYED